MKYILYILLSVKLHIFVSGKLNHWKVYNYNEFNTVMDTIIMVSKYGKKLDPHRLILTLTDTIKFKQEWYVSLSNLTNYYTKKNIKKSYKNNKFKISAPIWNDKFELPDRSYSLSDIQDYFEYIVKKH